MSAVQFFLPYQSVAYNGIAQPGAKFYFYTTGTTTPLAIYSNSGLSIIRSNPVVANGSGQLPTFYLDNTKTYRLVIKDKNDASLGVDIDPYIPGTIPDAAVLQPYADSAAASASIATTQAALSAAAYASIASVANATAHAATRTALALLGSSVGPVFLRESGREGMFVWTSLNVSAYVTADATQGIYVAPTSDATGASGAWVRKNSWVWNAQWFGAVGDALASGTGTDNTAAFNSALALGALLPSCEIMFPAAAGHYLFSTAPNEITSGIKITGQGWHENPGIVNGVTYTPPRNYTGSVLRFAADVKGLTFSAYTNQLANAPVAQFQSATQAIVRDIMLLGLGGTGIISHGIDAYVCVQATNIRVYGFAGNGVNLAANTAGALRYGSTDLSQFCGCTFDNNKLHGVYLDGNDDNVVNFVGCSFRNNGGCGSLDTTVVGNNAFSTCQWATNNRSHPTNSASGYSAAQIAKVQADAPCLTSNLAGSAVMYRGKDYSGNDTGNLSMYACCYSETGTGGLGRIRAPSRVDGGSFAQVGSRHSEWTAQTLSTSEMLNTVTFTNINQGGTFTFNDANMLLTASSSGSTANPKLTLSPQAGTFSEIAMLGSAGSAALGLDIAANNGTAYYSANTQVVRNAAQNATYGTWNSSALNLGASIAFWMNGNIVFNSSRILQAGSFPALTGDVTTVAGALATTISSATVVTKIAAQAIAPAAVAATGAITSSSSTGGVGYAAGAGGTAAQSTNKATTVSGTNRMCVDITLDAAALAASTTVSFTFTNTVIAATDNLIINHISGGTFGSYTFNGRCAAGSATIDVRNVSLGSLSEAIVIRVTVLKGANT